MESEIRNRGKVSDLVFIFFITLLIPFLSSYLSDVVHPWLSSLYPGEDFLYKSIHHIFQLILSIGVMFALSRKFKFSAWGWNLNQWQLSLKWIGIFGLVWFALQYWGLSNQSHPHEYEVHPVNQIGNLGFQYLLSGTGEEPLFRGIVMVFLAKHWHQIFKVGKIEFPITGIIATLLFMFAHIQIDWLNLEITHLDWGQQMNSLQLGILYALAFHQTKSLLAPIVMHGLSNGLIYTILFYILS